MAETALNFEVDEYIEPGLRYSEESPQLVKSVPVRYCYLWRDGLDHPVSELELLSFNQRFGAVAVPAEGIGGVETLPEFRRQGYMRRLIQKALEGAARRVNVVFVSEAIEGVYEKYGFANCLADAHLSLPVRHVELGLGESAAVPGIRAYRPDDLPQMINLYNETHAHRPWTHERQDSWNRLIEQQTWSPGSEVLVFEAEGKIKGYAILEGQRFGKIKPPVVDELAARDVTAVRALLAAVVAWCWQLRLSEFVVHEPFDSLVGREARRLGCQYHQHYPASGGMMGAVIHRQPLLAALEPELRRRADYDELAGEHSAAFEALQQAELVPDHPTLLRLLLGYWSMADAQAAGTSIPARYERICSAWFPGGGTRLLPAPYAHKLDRY